jgi:ATP-dependent DNA helicase 2 subunit 2
LDAVYCIHSRVCCNDSSAGDLSKEIEPQDRVKAYRYGKELIPFNHDDEQLMKFESERCLTLLCFASAAKIPRHYFLSSVDVVVPEPDSKSASVGIASLAHALHRTQHVAIVRYVKRKNAAPILGVLTPCIANGFPDSNLLGEDASTFTCLLLNQLPFAEDLRLFTFPSFDANPKLVPSPGRMRG